MRLIFITAALVMFSGMASAHAPRLFTATNPEEASGFKDLADCEKALTGLTEGTRKAHAAEQGMQRGSLFNRTRGNLSRCEMHDGEPLIVVYPPELGEKGMPPGVSK